MTAGTGTAAATVTVTDRAVPFARAFRAVAWAELTLVFGQALLAGQFLDGADLVWLHGINANVLQLLSLSHLVIGILLGLLIAVLAGTRHLTRPTDPTDPRT